MVDEDSKKKTEQGAIRLLLYGSLSLNNAQF